MEASLTFIGTATTLLRLGPFTVLTDPNFLRRGQRVYLGKGLWSRRLTDPAVGVGDLPPLDVVVLSHLHGDHWDRVAERGLDRAVPVLTTPQAADRLRRKGFATRGLDPWERVEVPATDGAASLTVEALPAVHARGVMGRLLPPVMGSLMTYRQGGRALRVYVSGDTWTVPAGPTSSGGCARAARCPSTTPTTASSGPRSPTSNGPSPTPGSPPASAPCGRGRRFRCTTPPKIRWSTTLLDRSRANRWQGAG